MNFEKSQGLDLLPSRLPAPQELGGDRDLYARLREQIEEQSEDEQRAILWTIALQKAFEEQRIGRSVAGLEMVTYGFADPEYEKDAFAALLYTAPGVPELDEILLVEPQTDLSVKIGNLQFPAFIRPSRWEFHQLPQIHPANGTAACWARSLKPSLQKKVGLVTAKHVVGQRILGNPVPLTKGLGKLLDLAPEGIDAALIQVPRTLLPSHLHHFVAQTHIAQWTDVQVYGRESGIFQTKVIEVTPSRGSLHYTIPLRVFLANPGKPGDSGSLVLNANAEGVGIYMGSVTSLANDQQEGFCQHLGQAAETLALELLL
ncbi:MAG TPA: hypothetical protein VGU63_08790 [Candidatus Acidoferrales bacterium]|nr:hypothetical protein [Candidatus Acidoferrales bacterium]